jgi:hypothetical protein
MKEEDIQTTNDIRDYEADQLVENGLDNLSVYCHLSTKNPSSSRILHGYGNVNQGW